MANLNLNKIKEFLNKDISSSKIDSRIMSLFLKQLSLLIGAGVPLDRSLKIIEQQKLDKKLSKALHQINLDLSKGLSINDAFTRNKKFFNPMLVAFIKSGDQSGRMAEVLDELSTYINEESKNKNIIKQALTYPIMLLFVMIIIIVIIMNFVLPTFEGIFESFGKDLPTSTKILLGISRFISNYGFYIIIFLLAIVFSILILRKDNETKLKIDKFSFLKLPFFKYRRLSLEYQLTSLLYILKAGDVDIVTSLDIIKESFKNQFVKQIFNEIIIDLKKGFSLSSSLYSKKVFSPLLISMIKIGEDSGEMRSALEKSSEYFATDYIYKLRHISSLAEPVMIIVMSIVVAFVVFAIALPIFESVNGVGF
ncbi:type II secretion system F family protein [uncultured Anaerococcus sp.]|uniref:type II secretion system F family protein n=1 Tax=uncultured Anaerococcus sp. TaxID=293428 RepID=UPI0025EE72AD|nr:type II secretion system F family protein [uncultured Anaerococcus sp.]